MNPSGIYLSFPSSSTSLSFSNIRRSFGFFALLTLSLAALSSATPLSRRASRRQTVTDGDICDVIGPEMVDFDKSEGPKTFGLTKTGSCQVGFVDIYQIVSYSPKNYQLFSYRTLADGASVEVTIHLAWPKPSASASDRNQYLVYKGYASEQDKNDGEQPIVQKFVKISIVERQPEGNLENYRDPLSSTLMKPPTPIYFLDEESAMANASCVTNGFRFNVKAAAKLEGVNPKLSMEVAVYQQTESGSWDEERAWSDGGDSRDDWSAIADDIGTVITTKKSENLAEMSVEVVSPLVDAYFVFNVLVEDELNWYRTGSAHYIAKWVQKKCDGSSSDIDSLWDDIDANTPPTTTTQATTIRPNVIVDITDNENHNNNNNNNNNNEEEEEEKEEEKEEENNNNIEENNNNNSNGGDENEIESENISSNSGDNGINKDATDAASTFAASSVSLLSITTTLFSCALCILWSR